MIEKVTIGTFKDHRGLLMWCSPEIVGFDYKYLTIGTVAKGCLRGNHYHKRIFEKILCISGKMTFKLDDEETTLEPGELVTIPVGSMHTVLNYDNELVTFIEFKNEEFTKEDPDIHVR